MRDLKLENAYKAGLDYAKHGANESNCHFSIFSTPAKVKAWEQGTKDFRGTVKTPDLLSKEDTTQK